MVEIICKGIIAKWSKTKAGFKSDGVTPYGQVSLQLQGETDWHSFFTENAKTAEDFKQSAPVGSEVEFTKWKKNESDQYWNYKKDSFKILKKAEGGFINNNNNNTSGNNPAMTKHEWDLKELRSHRIQALNNATALACQKIINVDEIAEKASFMVAFVYLNMDDPSIDNKPVEKDKAEQPKEEAVQEEEIKEE